MAKDQTEFNFISVIRFLYRWRVYLIGIVLLAGVVSFILASPPLTTPKYKSSAVFYPTTSGAFSNNVMQETHTDEQDYISFAEEEEAEKMLQILKSQKVKSYIRKQYNLMEHYDIDADKKGAMYDYNEQFERNITFEKTQFLSIRVSVMDKDPQKAASIANDIVHYADSLKNILMRKKAMQAFRLVKHKYQDKLGQINTMTDSIKTMAQKGVFNIAEQAGGLSEGYARALINNNYDAAEQIKAEMDTLGKYGATHYRLKEGMVFELKELAKLHKRYNFIKADANQDVSNIYVISEAFPSDKKASPVRSVIAIVSMLVAFLFATVMFVFIDKLSAIRNTIKA